MAIIPAAFKPHWIRTYAAVVLAVSVAVNLITSFSLYVQALTIPGMQADFRLSYTEAFILVAALSLSRVVAALTSGVAASRYGGRWLVIGSMFGSSVAMGLLGWSPNYWTALATMVAVGTTSGSGLTPMMGMLPPWFGVSDRGVVAGIAASGGSLAIVVIGLVVPPLNGLFGDQAWRYTWFLLSAASLVIGLLCVWFIKDAPKPPAGQSPAALPPSPRRSRAAAPSSWPMQVYSNPYVWLITGMAFCSGFVQGIVTSSYGAYLGVEHNVPVATVGILFMAIGWLSIGSGIVPGALSDRMGRGLAFGGTFLIQALSHALFWLLPDVGVFIVASILTGLVMRATYTLCAASAGDYVPVFMAPAAFGLMGMGAGIGSTLSPVIAGPVADATGTLQWAFAMATGAALVGAVLGFALHFRGKPAALAKSSSR